MKLGVEIFFFKIPIGRTIFIFSSKTSDFFHIKIKRNFSIKKNPYFFRLKRIPIFFCHFFCLIRGERAKRASANSRHVSRAREAGRHLPRSSAPTSYPPADPSEARLVVWYVSSVRSLFQKKLNKKQLVWCDTCLVYVAFYKRIYIKNNLLKKRFDKCLVYVAFSKRI